MSRRRALPRPSSVAAIVLAGVSLAGAGAGITAAAESGGIGPAGAKDPATGDGQFPIRGKHTYGDGLGAGRNHQGQDLMAKCGKPVVAAQPGRVQFRDYQASGAGNYVVIDGKGKLQDTVYMHLSKPTKLREGNRVDAGDLVGRVGSTGRSSACHLHFEMWSGAGWYEGGRPIDPKPFLKRWDKRG